MEAQQRRYDASRTAASQVADLTATFLHKRVRATKAGMLTKAHRKKYSGKTGVVSRIVTGQVAGLEIVWEDGSTSQSLPYMVTLTEV